VIKEEKCEEEEEEKNKKRMEMEPQLPTELTNI
jgi:hypothetical protein